jgi:hypothetical protein
MTHLSNLFPLYNERVLWPAYALENLRFDFCQVQDSSLFQNIHTTSGAQPVSYQQILVIIFSRVKVDGWDMKLAIHLHVVLRLRTSAVYIYSHHMPAWCAKGQYYL